MDVDKLADGLIILINITQGFDDMAYEVFHTSSTEVVSATVSWQV